MRQIMKHSKILLLSVIPLLLSGCGDAGETTTTTTPSQDTSKGVVMAKLPGMINPDKASGYDLQLEFDDKYFDASANQENHKLKLLSFGASLNTAKIGLISFFYTTMFYDNPYSSDFANISEDSVGYYIAHKSIGDYELVALAIRGFDYAQEWANNLKIGKTGNHAGFEERANEIYDSLKTYLNTYSGKEIKLWMTGYSRGGGIVNVLASQIMKEKSDISIKKENLFVYTFEAPRGLTEENAVEYQNVFNYVNNMDPVPKLAPEEYGLYRCGKDIIINQDKDVDQACLEFDEGITLPTFTPSEGKYTNELEFVNYIFGELLKNTEVDSNTLHTREKYVDNYQNEVGYFIGLFFTFSAVTKAKITARFQALSALGKMTVLADNGIYNFLKPILDEDNVQYDDEQFKPACQALNKLVQAKFSLLYHFIDTSTMGLNAAAVNNMTRAISMHYPETIYVLIK